MSRILILSKTKMQEHRVCVGGVDIDNKCSVRLLDHAGHHETIENSPYNLLSIWDVDYIRTNRRPAPHLEDVSVYSRRQTEYKVSPKVLLHLHKYNIAIYNKEPIINTFDGLLRSTEKGSLYICKESGIPNFSTCFWICDRPLRENRYSTEEKIKFDYCCADGRWYHITYVGVDNIPDVIPTGTLIRLSLANWWHPADSGTEDRCYLQISGIFKISLTNDSNMIATHRQSAKAFKAKYGTIEVRESKNRPGKFFFVAGDEVGYVSPKAMDALNRGKGIEHFQIAVMMPKVALEHKYK